MPPAPAVNVGVIVPVPLTQLGTRLKVGRAFTVTVDDAVLEQPLAVTVTV